MVTRQPRFAASLRAMARFASRSLDWLRIRLSCTTLVSDGAAKVASTASIAIARNSSMSVTPRLARRAGLLRLIPTRIPLCSLAIWLRFLAAFAGRLAANHVFPTRVVYIGSRQAAAKPGRAERRGGHV